MGKKAKLDPKLEPKAETIVPTGDEIPTDKVDPNEARKAMFKKGRENRELTTRQEDEAMPDAAQLRQAAAEAADGDVAPEIFDTEKPDRFAEEVDDANTGPGDDEYVEVVDHEKDPVIAKEVEVIDQKPAENLEYEVTDGKVKAVINGTEYMVPEADVLAAGGLTQYQRHRAANILFEQSATNAKALIEERRSLEQPQPGAKADGEPPAKGALDKKATLEDQRQKVLNAVLDGEEADLDSVINEIRHSGQATKPTETDTGVETVQGTSLPKAESAVEDYEQTWKAQLQEANTFLVQEYSDVVSDPDLRNIGDRKFKELKTDPANRGRLPIDMAREAGEFARDVSTRGTGSTKDEPKENVLEARREKKRTLPKTSQAHQRTRTTPQESIPSARDHIKSLQRASGQGATRKYR